MARSKSRFGHGTGKPHPVDVHIGARVRMRRKLLGMTQTKLGDALGLTFQQVQKYERGANRIGSCHTSAPSPLLSRPAERMGRAGVPREDLP